MLKSKPRGWEEYMWLTDSNAKEIDLVVKNDDLSVDVMMKKI